MYRDRGPKRLPFAFHAKRLLSNARAFPVSGKGSGTFSPTHEPQPRPSPTHPGSQNVARFQTGCGPPTTGFRHTFATPGSVTTNIAFGPLWFRAAVFPGSLRKLKDIPRPSFRR